MTPRLPLAVASIALIALTSACSAHTPSPTKQPTKPSATTPAATVAPTPPPTEKPAADPTCETIISPGTVEGLKSQHWTPKQDEFRVGDIVVDGGILCMWADYSVASDHGQMYGWAPASPELIDKLRSSLNQAGWQKIDDAAGDYLTEDPNHAFSTDEDGYGMTYQFGDGWVKVADTKQGLILIDWR